MIFNGKITHHKELSEATASVEFSEGDLIELREICKIAKTEWGNLLLEDINSLFKCK